jgi:hypothetical protein
LAPRQPVTQICQRVLEQGGVDVAHHRIPAAIGIAAGDVGEWGDARVHPPLAVPIGCQQHPVTNGERRPFLGELAHEARLRTQVGFSFAVVHDEHLALHLGHPRKAQR